MKPIVRYSLFAIFLSISFKLASKDFITDAKIWRNGVKVCSDPFVCSYKNYAYKFHGDSIINDTIYSKLYTSSDESLTNWKIFGLWRETSGNKVFKRVSTNQHSLHDVLMYDFALKQNDLFISHEITYKVDSVLSEMWGGKLRKYWYLNPVHAEGDTVREWYKTLWVEDVGQINSFLMNVNYGAVGVTPYLLCFEENGQQVYQNPEYSTCFYTSLNDIPNPDKRFKVYPNPVSGELFIQPTSKIEETYTLEMYSVKGELVKTECLESGSNLHRIVVSSLQNGIYILRLISGSGKYDEKVIIKE